MDVDVVCMQVEGMGVQLCVTGLCVVGICTMHVHCVLVLALADMVAKLFDKCQYLYT